MLIEKRCLYRVCIFYAAGGVLLLLGELDLHLLLQFLIALLADNGPVLHLGRQLRQNLPCLGIDDDSGGLVAVR